MIGEAMSIERQREGDNLHTEYVGGGGRIIRTTYFGYFSESQVRFRRAWAESIADAMFVQDPSGEEKKP